MHSQSTELQGIHVILPLPDFFYMLMGSHHMTEDTVSATMRSQVDHAGGLGAKEHAS